MEREPKKPSILALAMAGAKPRIRVDGLDFDPESAQPIVPEGAVTVVVQCASQRDIPNYVDYTLEARIQAANEINRAWSTYYAQVNPDGHIEAEVRRKRPIAVSQDRSTGRIVDTASTRPIPGNNKDRERHKPVKVRLSARKGVV
jgi:hypothetical protein